VILCLLPAFFIAGAIGVFLSKESVMRYLGAGAPRTLAYGVASFSGTILSVCSCTVLPLFAGIWRMGAGLGPAIAFLYSGPAISFLAIVMTARILGLEIGVARAVGAIAFSLIIGSTMAFIFRKEESLARPAAPRPEATDEISLVRTVLWLGAMMGILLFANWSDSGDVFFARVAEWKWRLTSLFTLALGIMLVAWWGVKMWKAALWISSIFLTSLFFPSHHNLSFAVGTVGLSILTATEEGVLGEWFNASWDFAKMIAPLLLGGVFVSGFLLGRPGEEGIIPHSWIFAGVGGNSLEANFVSAVVGAFMYFATLTEIPILQGLIGNGMGKGPALALLLAGPALSLPSMLALNQIMGLKKTAVYTLMVVVMSTVAGWIYGICF